MFDKIWGVLVAAGLAGRVMFRPAPKPMTTAERLAALPAGAPVDAPLTIHWDGHQIPFIEAESDRDLAVGLGLVHAHLRLGQIETTRRVALGRVSEMVGPLGVEVDRSLRLLDLGRPVPAIIAALPEETRRWAQGFVDGYNHYLATVAELPAEFAILGLEREPWTLVDLFTYARLMAADANWFAWGRLLRAKAVLPPTDWAALWQRLVASGAPATLANQPVGLAAQALAAQARGGSNSVAVAARRSAGGSALIASDPHLPLGLPNPCLIAGLHSPQTQAVGLMMPGVPSLPIGRNRWIAWGGTNLYAQTSDLFDISTLPAERIATRVETVKVRGGGGRKLKLRRCPLGPVVSDGGMLRHPRPLALRWVGHQPTDELGAMLAIARARNWGEFSHAAGGLAVPGLNMTFAATDGTVGQLLAAQVPRHRGSLHGDLVTPWEQAWEPQDRASAADLPSRHDPAEGYVASANDRPPESAFEVGLFFAPGDRIERLRLLLGGERPIGVTDLVAMHQDVHHAQALPLRDLLAAGLGDRPRPAAERHIVTLLEGWDGSYDAGSQGATAFEFLLARTIAGLWPRRALAPYEAVRRARPLIHADLERLPPETLAAALDKALARLARRWPKDARWGQVHRFRLRHALGVLPGIGKRFGIADFPASGSNDTLNKTAHGLSARAHATGFGAAARHISDLGDADANHFLLLGGQDGWFGSTNFGDQARLWDSGRYIAVPLRLATAQARFAQKTVIVPI